MADDPKDYAHFYDQGYHDGGGKAQGGWRIGAGRDPSYAYYARIRLPLFGVGSRVLDVGCADGGMVREYRELGLDAWGVDVSASAVAQAADDVKPYLSTASVLNLPFEDHAFDWTVSGSLLEHIHSSDIQKVLQELQRVAPAAFHGVSCAINGDFGDCTSGGLDLPGIDQGHISMYTPRWWEEQFRLAGIFDAGFVVVESCSWGPRRFGALSCLWPCTTPEAQQWLLREGNDQAMHYWTQFLGTMAHYDHPNHLWGARGVIMSRNEVLSPDRDLREAVEKFTARFGMEGFGCFADGAIQPMIVFLIQRILGIPVKAVAQRIVPSGQVEMKVTAEDGRVFTYVF